MLPDELAVIDDSRGMLSLLRMLAPESPAQRAARALLATRDRMLICCGFPVAESSESDGPPGAVLLARALIELGKDVTVVSWREALDAWSPVLGDIPRRAVRRGAPLERLSGASVTIEVCGRLPDGSYANMRGADIRDQAPWFEDALGNHALISIGDGGNEYGMGSAPAEWFASRPVRRPISTCDVLVVGQVSNWATLAVLAALARATGKALLPTPSEYQSLLDHLAQHGVVDGVRRVSEPTEDGHPLGRGKQIVEDLQRWLGTP